MTPAEWDKHHRAAVSRLHFEKRLPHFQAWHLAMEETIRTHGQRPKELGRLPLNARIVLWWAKKKLEGMKPEVVSMTGHSSFVKKLIVSVVYGISVLSAVLTAALEDGVINGDEWFLMLSAFAAAFWGKFSSNTTIIAPSREGETVTEFGPKK